MSKPANTVLLRLEGPLQSWGDNSKFVIRRSMDTPTKSGVLGLVCCAMGLSREKARDRLPKLRQLRVAVRIDRPGVRWWDFHTVGAGYGNLTAQGKLKKTATTGEYETLVTRREYLADASFLVALQGSPELIASIARALKNPRWPLFLGRKSCPPSVPVLTTAPDSESWANPGRYDSLMSALGAVPWHPRLREIDHHPQGGELVCLVEWQPDHKGDTAPDAAEVWYDEPVSFDIPVHEPRLVLQETIRVEIGEPLQRRTPSPPRPRADYQNSTYKDLRAERLRNDKGACVFCKSPVTADSPIHHVTYRRAGGSEALDDLRSLCRLCHDAVTMIEYGLGMGLDRINPEDPRWRDQIIEKREQIVRFRSLETRRRRFAAEEVE